MLRLLLVMIVSILFGGCRSQPNCNPFSPAGMRVPPPTTGSYGAPNTYYPNVGPRTSALPAPPGTAPAGTAAPATGVPATGVPATGVPAAAVPATVPRATIAASGGWRSVAEDRPISASALAAESTAVVAPPGTVAPLAPIASGPATAAAGVPRINGMRVNEAKRTVVAPASFATPATDSTIPIEPTVKAESPPAMAPPVTPASTNTLRATPAPPATEARQVESAPASNRFAGG